MTSAPGIDLSGRIAVVTGASRGLGYEIALAMSRAGATVVVSSRKDDACKEAAAAITDETRGTVVPIPVHVGRWDTLDAYVAGIYEEVGDVDILVNNAGSSPLYPSLIDVTEKYFDAVMGANLKGTFRLSVLVGSRMAEGGGGSIINVSSNAALHATPRVLPYAAAKAGVNALTIGLAQAFGPTVRVNTIMPGTFLTPGYADKEAGRSGAAAAFALGRWGEPPEIAGTALFLASDLSSYQTGSVVTVDGGRP